jgi:rubrerythrin
MHRYRAMHYVQLMWAKYAEIAKTQDFDTISRLIKDMTDISAQSREPLHNEMKELLGVKGELEIAAQEWRTRARPPAAAGADAAAARCAPIAEQSLQLTAQLAHAAREHLAAVRALDAPELIPPQVEQLLTAVTEKTSPWLWATQRLAAQRAAQQRQADALRAAQQRRDALAEEVAGRRSALEAARARGVARLCPACRGRRREVALPCGHAICRECADPGCPVCGAPSTDLRPIHWS